MSLEVPTPLSCTLVQAATDPPYLGRGTVIRSLGDRMDIQVNGPTHQLATGASLVVEFPPDSGATRAIVMIDGVNDGVISAHVRRLAPPDKREYPRVEGPVHLRYHVAPSLEAAERWLGGGPAEAEEYEPDPFMNFSVTGLMFEDLPRCAEGDMLLLTFSVPNETKEWRCAGSVVRVQVIPVDERDDSIAATHRVAMHFLRLPEGGAEALRRHTIHIQEAWMGGESDKARP